MKSEITKSWKSQRQKYSLWWKFSVLLYRVFPCRSCFFVIWMILAQSRWNVETATEWVLPYPVMIQKKLERKKFSSSFSDTIDNFEFFQNLLFWCFIRICMKIFLVINPKGKHITNNIWDVTAVSIRRSNTFYTILSYILLSLLLSRKSYNKFEKL